MKNVSRMMLASLSLLIVNTALRAAPMAVVMPVRDGVAAYRNETRGFMEQPLFIASADDRLPVIKAGKASYLVKNRDGLQGWIEKAKCVRASGGTSFGFDSLIIQTQWDHQISVIGIFDADLREDGRIFIDRSFRNELLSNSDKYELEREAEF